VVEVPHRCSITSRGTTLTCSPNPMLPCLSQRVSCLSLSALSTIPHPFCVSPVLGPDVELYADMQFYPLSGPWTESPAPETAFFSAKELRKRLTRWVARNDNLPFSVVEDADFCSVVDLLKPSVSVSSADTIKRDIMKRHREETDRIREQLCSAGSKISPSRSTAGHRPTPKLSWESRRTTSTTPGP
jgi:hypothetical protein